MSAQLLQRPTLVLNRHWQPIQIATVARALVLLLNESARVVDPNDFSTFSWDDWTRLKPKDGEEHIRTVRMQLRIPEAITLVEFAGQPIGTVSLNRRNLFKRDHYACQYCGVRPGGNQLTIDHVLPRAQGGETRWDNCVLACVDCNFKKGNRTPSQANMRLKRKPVQPTWHPLFAVEPVRIASWSKLVSEAYWNVELER